MCKKQMPTITSDIGEALLSVLDEEIQEQDGSIEFTLGGERIAVMREDDEMISICRFFKHEQNDFWTKVRFLHREYGRKYVPVSYQNNRKVHHKLVRREGQSYEVCCQLHSHLVKFSSIWLEQIWELLKEEKNFNNKGIANG